MTKLKQELKGVKSKDLLKNNKNFLLGSIVATILAISPYIFYSYEVIPNTKIWDNFLFTYNSNYYESALTAWWTIMGKAFPLFLLFIWFFTCRHWWHHVLLIPITMYMFQLGNVLNDDLTYVDNYQFKYLIPVMAIIIPSIYLVRARIFNKLNTVDKSTQELEDELTFKPNTLWGKIKQFF